MTTVADRLAEIAVAEIGAREQGHNAGPRVVQYQEATWLKPGPWPWCAAFVAWSLREWLHEKNTQDALGIGEAQIERWRCKDALAFGWETWALKRGLLVLPETTPMRAGDIVTFDFSHIGIVIAGKGDTIHTVEGNTNADGSREGDGVYAKRRPRHLIRRVIRILA